MIIDSAVLSKLLKGKLVVDLSAVRFDIIDNFTDYSFIYCLNVYLLLEGNNSPIMITSNQAFNNDYSLYIDSIDNNIFKARFDDSEMSDYMIRYDFQKYIGKRIEYSHVCEDCGNYLSLNFMFDDSSVIHIVSGEYYETDKGNNVAGPDEMVIVFDSTSKAKKYNLNVYDFCTNQKKI